jgi:hypothetical protein
MEQIDSTVQPENSYLEDSGQASPAVQSGAAAPPSFVYALGQIQPRFPNLSVEKEFAQVIGRVAPAGTTDREALQVVLSDRANRYLARQVCWVFAIEGLETYLLTPRDPADLDLLVEAVRPRPEPTDLDVVIGILGPFAPPAACGLAVRLVAFDQLYSFDRPGLLAAIPRPDNIPQKEDGKFRASAAEVFDRIMQLADNAGATDEHRALNYLAVRHPGIYAQTAYAHASNMSLTAVDVRPSRLSGTRVVFDVIFSYTHRQTDVVEKHFVRVDVTEEFPFLVSKLAPYYDR